MKREPLVVALIPAYNEERAIGKVILQARKYVSKVIVCDDGSKDKTSTIAKALGATVVKHKRNLGYGAALSTLFRYAKKLNADTAVTLDADGQHDPSYIPRLIEPILGDSTDIVIGSRFLSAGGQDGVPAYRKIGIRLITRLSNIATNGRITDAQSGFRAYSREALQKIQPTDQGMGASTEILIQAKQASLRVKETSIIMSYEGETSKKNPVVHWSEVILSTINSISVNCPQIFYGIPGISVLIASLGFWMSALPGFFVTGDVEIGIILMAIEGTITGVALLAVTLLLWLRKHGATKKIAVTE